MQIGTIKLGHDNRLAGTIDYHGRILRLLMKPLSKPTGPTHELLSLIHISEPTRPY